MIPLHLITDQKKWKKEIYWNPAFSYIQLKYGVVNVTNGIALVRIDAEEVFGEDLSKKLEDRELYFFGNDWKNAKMDKAFSITEKDNVFTAFASSGIATGNCVAFTPKQLRDDKDIVYPQTDAVIGDDSIPKENPVFSLNPGYLDLTIKAMGCESTDVNMLMTEKPPYVLIKTKEKKKAGGFNAAKSVSKFRVLR